MMIRGSCLCGAVRYEIAGPVQLMGHCHCSMCRKANGAAFSTWAILEPGQLRWIAGESALGRYASSAGRERLFCARCGSSLAASHGGHVTEVLAGSLDDDPGARPREHIFVASKAAWHDITDALPQHAAWPPGMEP